jgi:hypothetical protein
MNEEHDEIALDDITIDDVVGAESSDNLTEGLDLPEEDADPEPEEDTFEEIVADEDVEDSEEKVEETEEEEQEEEKTEDDEDAEPTVVSEVLEQLGYEPDEEYDDTPEGLAAMTKDIASQIADERIDDVLENFPLVKKHLEYVLQGGKSQNFMEAHDPNMDYTEFNLKEDDAASQKVILSNYFELKGHDKDFINELLEDYEDTGKLYKKAGAAKEALGKYQQQEREEMFEKQRQQNVESQQAQKEFWDGVAGTIDESQDLAGINLPQKDKSKFFNYISKPVNDQGQTQRDLDHSEADIDVKLAIDYLMYKGFDINGLVDKKAKTQSTRSLRDKLSGRQESIKSAKKATRRNKRVDVDDLDLSI